MALLGQLCADAGQSRPEDAVPTLIDQGDNDPFLAGQLQPAAYSAEVAAAEGLAVNAAHPARLRPQLLLALPRLLKTICASMRSISLAKRQCAAKLLRGACSGLTGRVFSAGNQKR